MQTTTISPNQNDRFRDDNAALFVSRRELSEQLDQAIVDHEAGLISARRVRRLRRHLDDVTTEIVTYNMGLVRSYTRRFGGTASSEDRAEFESAGLLGLMRAIDSFDPDSGAFGHWAFKPIQREVLRSVRDVDHPNLNLGDFEKRPVILRAFRHLQGADESYRPTDEEVAELAEVPLAQVRRVLAPPRLASLHQTTGDDNVEMGDTIASVDIDTDADVLVQMTLAGLHKVGLQALDNRELYVVVRRFGLDGEPSEKLADIGVTLDLSREAVRQIEAKALAKLQHPIVMRKLGRADKSVAAAA